VTARSSSDTRRAAPLYRSSIGLSSCTALVVVGDPQSAPRFGQSSSPPLDPQANRFDPARNPQSRNSAHRQGRQLANGALRSQSTSLRGTRRAYENREKMREQPHQAAEPQIDRTRHPRFPAWHLLLSGRIRVPRILVPIRSSSHSTTRIRARKVVPLRPHRHTPAGGSGPGRSAR